jgi:hypothetical protein
MSGSGAAAAAGMELADSIGGWIATGVTRAQNRRAFENIVPYEVADALYEAARLGDIPTIDLFLQEYPSLQYFQHDPNILATEKSVLEDMMGIARDGYTPEERAYMQGTMMDAYTAERGAREAREMNLRQRGMGDSGLGATMQAVQGQQAANRAFRTASDMGMQGLANRRAALQAAADQASRIRGQNFGEAQAVSAEQAAIDAANVAQRYQTQSQNIANQMQRDKWNQDAYLAQAAAHQQAGQDQLMLDIQKAQFGEQKYS